MCYIGGVVCMYFNAVVCMNRVDYQYSFLFSL